MSPIIIAAIQPPAQQAANDVGDYFSHQTVGALVVGLVVGWFVHILADVRDRRLRVRAGRDAFRAVTADMRAKLVELKGAPDDFIKQSVIILRPAVYRVESYARDLVGLQSCWQDYEQQNPEYFTASFRLADEILAGRKTDPQKTFTTLLKKMDDYVS